MYDVDHPSFKEFSEAGLAHPVKVHGVAMPAGARGVVMAVYADGQTYEVEFTEPHLVLTIEDEALQA